MEPLAEARTVDCTHTSDTRPMRGSVDAGVFLGAFFLRLCHGFSIPKTSLAQKGGRWFLETERLKKEVYLERSVSH